MEPCAVSTDFPTQACHNCRRGRRKCDRSIPTCIKCHSIGQVCLGYGKLVLWTNSVASRGKMMGKTFATNTASKRHPSASNVRSASPAISSKVLSSHKAEKVLSLYSVANWCWLLDDPVFQDVSMSSKFYLSYCKYALVCRVFYISLRRQR
jgi:hypothetical protein